MRVYALAGQQPGLKVNEQTTGLRHVPKPRVGTSLYPCVVCRSLTQSDVQNGTEGLELPMMLSIDLASSYQSLEITYEQTSSVWLYFVRCEQGSCLIVFAREGAEASDYRKLNPTFPETIDLARLLHVIHQPGGLESPCQQIFHLPRQCKWL